MKLRQHRVQVEEMKRATTTAQPIVLERTDPAKLAAFDQSTKVCTMNCGPHRDDPRGSKERKFQCGDCLTMEAPNAEVTRAMTTNEKLADASGVAPVD